MKSPTADFDDFVRRANEQKDRLSERLERQSSIFADQLAALHADIEQILAPWTTTGQIVLVYEDVVSPDVSAEAKAARRMTIMLGEMQVAVSPAFPNWAEPSGGVEIAGPDERRHIWIVDPPENGSGRRMARWVVDPGRGGTAPRALTKTSFLDLLMRLFRRH